MPERRKNRQATILPADFELPGPGSAIPTVGSSPRAANPLYGVIWWGTSWLMRSVVKQAAVAIAPIAVLLALAWWAYPDLCSSIVSFLWTMKSGSNWDWVSTGIGWK